MGFFDDGDLGGGALLSVLVGGSTNVGTHELDSHAHRSRRHMSSHRPHPGSDRQLDGRNGQTADGPLHLGQGWWCRRTRGHIDNPSPLTPNPHPRRLGDDAPPPTEYPRLIPLPACKAAREGPLSSMRVHVPGIASSVCTHGGRAAHGHHGGAHMLRWWRGGSARQGHRGVVVVGGGAKSSRPNKAADHSLITSHTGLSPSACIDAHLPSSPPP